MEIDNLIYKATHFLYSETIGNKDSGFWVC